MEEAYTALYQEFLRLQSLCLKQAAMLQHLTEALRRQQGSAPVSNGDLEGGPFPVLSKNNELETFTCPEIQAKTSQLQNPIKHPRGMDSLQLKATWDQAREDSHDEAAYAGSQGQRGTLESSITDELRQVEEHWHSSQAAKQQRRPWSSSFLNSELLSQAGGLLMSKVTLQSQVCEFCHAVFPGHTTTRGEFLRHLNTHVA
ncbi:uncharacterized protein LOC143514111 isoform X2 [Brachyhypopomus gauderio]|uniref:uncharacterized protein LOC143514111 isoform X2 n=1 Tax=Brachyhypopomus gauderio TaxID=698409 RepID=UPI0040435523